MKTNILIRTIVLISTVIILSGISRTLSADTGTCSGASITLPFADVMGSPFFCQIAEAYFTGLTNGTSANTYGPTGSVTREQMAAFVTRTMDQSLKRGSSRAALDQFWTPGSANGLALTNVGTGPECVRSDGADLWVANSGSSTVSRVRASDGRLLETWTGATQTRGLLVAKGLVFVTGQTLPGELYRIDPTQPAGPVTKLPISLGDYPIGISFDGERIWTANESGSISIVTLSPLSVTTVATGFTELFGIAYDGANMWTTDYTGKLHKLDSTGAIIQTVQVGNFPLFPIFDGTNIWVPCQSAVTVVRASTGAVVATLTGNGIDGAACAAFDGERVLVTSGNSDRVSLWKAADLSPLGSVYAGLHNNPYGACSDGINFWITLQDAHALARF